MRRRVRCQCRANDPRSLLSVDGDDADQASAAVPNVNWRQARFAETVLDQNGPDAREMGCLYYPRKQTSVSCAADCDAIVCYGGAKLTDKHLAKMVVEAIEGSRFRRTISAVAQIEEIRLDSV